MSYYRGYYLPRRSCCLRYVSYALGQFYLSAHCCSQPSCYSRFDYLGHFFKSGRVHCFADFEGSSESKVFCSDFLRYQDPIISSVR